MQSETIRIRWAAHYLGLMGFLVALVMASEAVAGALCPSMQSAASFAAGDGPASVTVADLDGETVPHH